MPRSIEPPVGDESEEELRADRFDDDEPTPILAVGTRDQLNEQAREATRRAAVTGTAGDDEVAALAHDLKNPLTIIMLESSQIETRLGPKIPPTVLRGLERIAQNASYIDRLVSDLLDMAASDAGRLELRLDRIDLSRLLRDAVGRAVPTQERGRIRLDIRDVLFVNGDEIRLERVVTNLVHNALKYGGEQGPVTVRLDARGAYACVSVIDTGPGLSAEDARMVFDRFRRAKTETQAGHGLGLYTSRRIIEAHKGRIGIASQLGRGARFFFELPILRTVAG